MLGIVRLNLLDIALLNINIYIVKLNFLDVLSLNVLDIVMLNMLDIVRLEISKHRNVELFGHCTF